MFSEPAGEVLFAFADEVAQFLVVVECRAFMECSGGVDRPGLTVTNTTSSPVSHLVAVFGPPLTGSIEVLQSEADRIDLAVTTSALGFFLVGEQSLTRGQNLICQP